MAARRLARLALFVAIALAIHTAEAYILLPVPVPGVKLGLCNVVTLFMLFWRDGGERAKHIEMPINAIPTGDVYVVLVCRVLLGVLIAGRPVAAIYSLAGGLLALVSMLVMKRFVTVKQIWAAGVMGAVFHNIGQILAAMLLTGTPLIASYLPILVIAGIITGALTGLLAGLAVTRLGGKSKTGF